MQTHTQTCCYGANAWTILNSIEQSIKRKVESLGTPLKDWDVEIYRGVLTGFNDAFIIDTAKRDAILNACSDEDERIRTAEIIRPILRGRDIKRYSYEWAEQWLIATFPARHYDIERFPAVKNYLESFAYDYLIQNGYAWIANNYLSEYCRKKLEQSGKDIIINGKPVLDAKGTKEKSRKKTSNKWFETQDSISYWDDLSKPKIVWGNLNQTASYAYADGTLFINAPGTMIVPASKYLLGTLNSKLADFYIRSLGVVRNAGYFEYKPMFVSKLPVILSVAESEEESFSKLIDDHDEAAIDKRVYELYGLTEEEANYLENW